MSRAVDCFCRAISSCVGNGFITTDFIGRLMTGGKPNSWPGAVSHPRAMTGRNDTSGSRERHDSIRPQLKRIGSVMCVEMVLGSICRRVPVMWKHSRTVAVCVVLMSSGDIRSTLRKLITEYNHTFHSTVCPPYNAVVGYHDAEPRCNWGALYQCVVVLATRGNYRQRARAWKPYQRSHWFVNLLCF